MSLFIASLNSGSNGNCYYIGNKTEAVLIDAGISCREIERRMKRLGLHINKVKAVFISHEHSDHIRGLSRLIQKYRLPVYITPGTARDGRLRLEHELLQSFKSHEPVTVGQLSVTAFPKLHDANDPYSFTVVCDNICIGVFTDIGFPCQNLIKYFQQCHAAFLESNYEDEMLEKGSYPLFLKQRIRGGMGHLSNNQALKLFTSHRPDFMSHLFLSHLSENNNCPELVEKIFNAHAGNVKIIIASRYKETDVYNINHTNNHFRHPVSHRVKSSSLQLSFSFG